MIILTSFRKGNKCVCLGLLNWGDLTVNIRYYGHRFYTPLEITDLNIENVCNIFSCLLYFTLLWLGFYKVQNMTWYIACTEHAYL